MTNKIKPGIMLVFVFFLSKCINLQETATINDFFEIYNIKIPGYTNGGGQGT
jgi:hypothetical protein